MDKVNFYRPSLIKKYLRNLNLEEKKLRKIKMITTCPFCGCHKAEIDSVDDYSLDSFLICGNENCEEIYDDIDYINHIFNLNHCGFDAILFSAWNDKNDSDWKELCEDIINSILNR